MWIKDLQFREFKWLMQQVRPYRVLYLTGLITLVLGGAIGMIDPLVMKWLIDTILPERHLHLLLVAAGILLISYVLRSALVGISSILSKKATENVIYNIRVALVTHLSTLSADYYDENPPGDLMFRLEQDVDLLAQFGADMLSSSIYTFVTALSTLVILYRLNSELACVILPVVPIFMLVRRRYRARLRRSADASLASCAAQVACLEQYLSSITHLQLLQHERSAIGRYSMLANEVKRTQNDRRKLEVKASAIPQLALSIGVAATVFCGGYLLTRNALTLGALVAFYSYLVRLLDPLSSVVDIDTRFLWAKASTSRVLHVLDAKPTIQVRPASITLNRVRGRQIRVREVSFRYQPDITILKGVTLRLEPGEKVALTGPSGCGKSTLAKLLMRIYDPEAGIICIGDEDIRNIHLMSLRSIAALVPPDPLVFEGTILENLLCGNPDASLQQCETVLRAVYLEQFIDEQPLHLHAPLGVRGAGLSGGQRQRLGIARALLRQPRILIMDECTSGLDRDTESGLLSSINSYLSETTTVLISHRPSVMKWADRILVMRNGCVLKESAAR